MSRGCILASASSMLLGCGHSLISQIILVAMEAGSDPQIRRASLVALQSDSVFGAHIIYTHPGISTHTPRHISYTKARRRWTHQLAHECHVFWGHRFR